MTMTKMTPPTQAQQQQWWMGETLWYHHKMAQGGIHFIYISYLTTTNYGVDLK